MIEYRKTEKVCEYRNWHFAEITEIYYKGMFMGWKYYDDCKQKNNEWYMLPCDLDTIEECESRFGYGARFADCGYMIYPQDGSLSIETIEKDIIPLVCRYIIAHEKRVF